MVRIAKSILKFSKVYVQGSVISFCVRSPSAATPGAVCHQQATVSLLLYVLESEADRAGSSDVRLPAYACVP